MIKKNLKLLIVTTILMLLPVAAGLILWDQLPAQMPSHWNAAGEVDQYSSKAFVVFGFPAIMISAQWLCSLGTAADPKKQNHSEKVIHLVLWIIPILSLVLHTITYATALGVPVRIELVMPVVIGLIFTIIGNYLPKCKQSYTIGIKIPWTLSSEENWNKTHRFAGWLWTVCGIAVILASFLGIIWILLGIMLLMVFAPIIYSYILYKKENS